MKIIISGHSGFIGSYFIKNYSKKYSLLGFSFSNNKISDLNFESVDSVIHLSAIVHQKKSISWESYRKINIDNTVKLAKEAKKNGVRQFVFMSTVKVYGEGGSKIYNEDSPCLPKNYYGKSKYIAEKKLQDLETENFKVAIIRTPLVYSRSSKGNLALLELLIKYIKIIPLGKIPNKRSMVCIQNLCSMIDIILMKDVRGTFLASDDYVMSTSELITSLAKLNKKKIFLFRSKFIQKFIHFFFSDMYEKIYGDFVVNNKKTKSNLGIKRQSAFEDCI